MDPPIQTLYLRSGGATTLTFMELGALRLISSVMRSAIPAIMVVPACHSLLLSKGAKVPSSDPREFQMNS